MADPDFAAIAKQYGGVPVQPTDVSATVSKDPTAAVPSDIEFAKIAEQYGGVPVSVPPPLGNQPQQDQGPTLGQRAAALLPSVGGVIGSLAGGTLGAGIGGAAGAGYEQLLRHLTELPGALKDVARLALEEPIATAKGALSGIGEGLGNVLEQGGLQAGADLVGRGLGAVAGHLAPGFMQSALKPGLRSTLAAFKSGTVPPVVRTLLDEGVNVTPGGIERLNNIIASSNDTIKAALDNLPASAEIRPLAVAGRLSDTARRFAQQVNPEADLSAVSEAGQEFLNHPRFTKATITPTQAQALKTGTYAQLKNKAYGELKGASIEAQKTLARGLKEEIASEASKYGIDISAVNAREGAAITAREAVAKRVAMAGNRDPAGLAWLAHNPTTFLLALMERSPVVKSLIARGLYQSAGKIAKVPAPLIIAAVRAVATKSDTQAGGQ